MYSDRIAAIAEEKTGGKIIHLREKKINVCHACGYCREIREGECIQKDDMTQIYQDFLASDTVFLISPVYWWQVTAQMKTFIDRLYAFKRDDWKGKKFVVILNGAASDDDVEFRILHDAFREMFSYLGVEYSFLGVGTEDEEDWNRKKGKIGEFITSSISSL